MSPVRIYGSCQWNDLAIKAMLPQMTRQKQIKQWIKFERLTTEARIVLIIANEFARQRSFDEIRPEHILWALLGKSKNVTSRTGAMGTASLCRRRIEQAIGTGNAMNTRSKLPLSASSQEVVRRATSESQRLAHPKAGIVHLLLGLLAMPSGLAVRELRAAGLTLVAVRVQASKLLSPAQRRNRDKEYQKIADLLGYLADWQEATQMRSFLAALKASANVKGIQAGSLMTYIEWAERWANALDPIERLLKSYISSP